MTNTLQELEELFTLSNELKELTGRIEKENLIAKHKNNTNLKLFFHYTLDSLLVFGLQSTKLKKALTKVQQGKATSVPTIPDLFTMFEYLKVNNTGKDMDALITANFINNQPARYHQWLIESITKSFKMGVTAKTVNKALGEELIFNFDVMLAHPFEKYADKIKGEVMYVTEKIDGNRSTFIKENGKVTGFSRQGKLLQGYSHIEEELASLELDNVVFDGELLIKGAEEFKDREVMQQTQSITGSKGDKSQLDLHLYDLVDLEGFKLGKSKYLYSARRWTLDNIIFPNLKHIKHVPLLYVGTELDKVMTILSEVEKEGKEGLMINLDGYYTLTRSNQILKLKTFSSFDERIISVFEGTGKYTGMLGGINVHYKTYPLAIGSGFTDEQRKKYWDNPELIIGKIAEISFFRESKNLKGGLSVSFPVFESMRFDKDEPSYS